MAGEPSTLIVPIFPLHTVLFPGMRLALRIFEPRYLRMLTNLNRSNDRFCVALIEEGPEVGGIAKPHTTGCLVEIVETREAEDAAIHIVAKGLERVRILSVADDGMPYLSGTVKLWPNEDPEPVPPDLVARVRDLFEQYTRYLQDLAGEAYEALELPTRPDLLSSAVAISMQTDWQERQRLLEVPGTKARLEEEAARLRVEVPLIRAMSTMPRPPDIGRGRFSAN